MSEEEKKGAGGRPTKYGPEMLRRAQVYIETYKDAGDPVPTIVGLALACKVATNTVKNWVSNNHACDEFLTIFTRVEQEQHQELVKHGLLGTFNPAITKMMMTKHGYSDKQELSHSSPDGTMSPTPTRIEIVAPSIKVDDSQN